MATIKNLTPHTVNILNEDGTLKAAFPSVGIARVASSEVIVGNVDGIPETDTVYGDVIDLPNETADTILIVSRLVLSAVRATGSTRSDLRVPGTQVRDDAGRVIGAKSLARS